MKLDEKIDNCSFIRTILMLSVVFYHSCVFWTGGWFKVCKPVYESDFLLLLSRLLNSFHVYCFVLVSGYLFYFLKFEKGKYITYKDLLKKKSLRLLVPYFAVCFLWVAPITTYLYGYRINEVVKSFVLGCSPSQLWFVLALFWIFALVWPISGLLRKNNIFCIISVLILFMLGVVGCKFSANFFCFFTGLQYTIYFVLGFKLRQYDGGKSQRIKWYYLVLLFLFLFVLNMVVDFDLMSIFVELLMHVVGSVAVFAALQELSKRVNWKSNKNIILLNKYSMAIYLIHQQLIYYIILIFNGAINPIMNALVNFVLSITISCILSWVLSNNRLTRLMIGIN